MKSVAIIGTNGIPAKYGGFETLVENLVKYLSNQYSITVFCSTVTGDSTYKKYNGCNLEYINLKANGWQSIFYDLCSLYKTRDFDKVIILGASGGIFMPLFKKDKDRFILNFGGLDWQRSKWSYLTRKFLKLSECLSIRFSKYLIADNEAIREYIQSQYGRESYLVTYGGDQSFKVAPVEEDLKQYYFLKLDYAFTLARIQSDNNIELILNAFDREEIMPLVFVGNWEDSKFGKKTKIKYSNRENLILLDAIYDVHKLNLLRSNCKLYIHGHTAGGTNPALVEAMSLSLPIIAYNTKFNEYTTQGKAKYFVNSNELYHKVNNLDTNDLKTIGNRMSVISKREYRWEIIADKYAKVIDEK